MTEIDLFKKLMGSYITGLSIVSTVSDGAPHAMTINSLNSISLAPPIISFAIRQESKLFEIFYESTSFGISILNNQQEHLARIFASKDLMHQKFQQTQILLSPQGNPLLATCLASMDCVKKDQHLMGDHLVIYASILNGTTCEGTPLSYFRRKYYTQYVQYEITSDIAES